MDLLVQIVAFVHLFLYAGIMWYGWQSYRLLRKRSWLYMGMGFFTLLVYRADRFYALWAQTEQFGVRTTFIPFTGAVFLVLAFWKLSYEHEALIDKLRLTPRLSAGAQPVDFWFEHFRRIVREELDKTVTVVKKRSTDDIDPKLLE